MKNPERRAQKLRRIAVMLILIAIGFLLGGGFPSWAKVVFPAVFVLWLMVYDNAMYEIYEKKATTPGSVSRNKK